MWNLETNMYTDEEGEERDPVMYDKLLPVRKNIEDVFTPKAKAFYEREFTFFNSITNISGIIKPFEKGRKRRDACLKVRFCTYCTRGYNVLACTLQVLYCTPQVLCFSVMCSPGSIL